MNLKTWFISIFRYSLLIFLFSLAISSQGQEMITKPVLTIIDPAPSDSLNNSGIILVRVQIISGTPLDGYRIFNNGEIVANEAITKLIRKDSITCNVESLVHLKKGFNTIVADASNRYGSRSSERRIIESHPEPFITWILPVSHNSIIESGPIKVKAEIKTDFELQDLNIHINDASFPVKNELSSLNKNTYILEGTYKPDRDRNYLFITASNKVGETKSSSRSVRISGLVPTIRIINPLPADSLNNSGIILVSADIVSRSPLLAFTIFSDNYVAASEAMAVPKRKDSITYSIESLVHLKRGINTIKIEARNISGTGNSEKLNINSHPEPFINWISPPSQNSVTETGNIKIEAEIKSDLDLKEVSININGEIIKGEGRITKLNNNTYALETNVMMNHTKNSIAVMAGNTIGLTRSSPRTVRISGQVPVIKVITPTINDTLDNTGIILVRADIISKIPIQTYRIYNNENLVASETMALPKRKDSASYIIESLVHLKTGLNALTLEARNSSGTSAIEKRYVTCKLEPIIKWILPGSASSVTGSELLTIKAELISSLDLQKTTVNINDKELSIDKAEIIRQSNNIYNFEKKIPLDAGENRITIAATNARGTAFSAKYNVTYKPEIISEVIWIAPGIENQETYSAEVFLSATIRTSSKIRNTALFVNDKEVIPGNQFKLTPGKATEYAYENSAVLQPGINTVYISTVTDEGTISSEKRSIKYIVPLSPVITWKNPSADQMPVTNSSVDIRLDIKSNTQIEDLVLYLNGDRTGSEDLIKGLRKEQDTYILEKSILLNTGVNRIYITAKNLAGSTTSETRSISYTYSAVPVITWVSPSNPSTDINQNSARITLKIQSSGKLQSLLTYINGSASEEVAQLVPLGIAGDYSLEKPVNLVPGRNEIYVIATNQSGTTKSDIRYLTNPPTNPPVISWMNPSDPKVIVNTEMVIIEACIKSATILKSVQILVNGVQQTSEMVFQQPGTGECNYRFTKPVILKNGDNSIYMIAENFAGSTPSEKRSLRYEVVSIAEKRLALVFGNADYGSSGSLKNPVNDANLMEGTLKDLGFDVIKRINAPKSEMEAALREFSNKLPKYNVALFYFAGHGIQVDGENYLIPVGADLENKTDCQWEALAVDRIVRQFEQVPDNINIIILDACRDNPFRSWTRGGEQGFRALNPVSGTFVSFATTAGSVAADGLGSNGTFTEELAKQMVIPQSIFNVFINTRKEVMRRTNNAQRPQEWNMLTGDFYFKK